MNKYIMNDSGANIFVVEDHATLKKMLPVMDGPLCMYRIMLVFWHLGWVDTDFDHSTVCLGLGLGHSSFSLPYLLYYPVPVSSADAV